MGMANKCVNQSTDVHSQHDELPGVLWLPWIFIYLAFSVHVAGVSGSTCPRVHWLALSSTTIFVKFTFLLFYGTGINSVFTDMRQ